MKDRRRPAPGLTAPPPNRRPTPHPSQSHTPGEFLSATGAVRSILAREGTRGMFAGYGSFLLRDLPFDAIEFVAYEQLKQAYTATLKGRDINAAEVSAIGMHAWLEGPGVPSRAACAPTLAP